MKKLLLLIVFSSLISCGELRYDAEKRLVFTTTVLDGNGNPLRNSHVEIITENDFDTDVISVGETDGNGKIKLIFPSPEGVFSVSLHVYNAAADYLEKRITGIPETNFVDYQCDYPAIYLLKYEELAPLNLSYNQVNINTTVKKVGLNGIYHMDNEPYYASDFFTTFPFFLVKKNQSFQLKYVVLNEMTNVETAHVIDLQIGTEPLNYTINY
jgi:5-hydroxyisourate hydrolase-like protein (transthyretin family)